MKKLMFSTLIVISSMAIVNSAFARVDYESTRYIVERGRCQNASFGSVDGVTVKYDILIKGGSR